jgi:hypothetical protein
LFCMCLCVCGCGGPANQLVEGVVLDSLGQPVTTGAVLVFHPKTSGTAAKTSLDPTGHYRLQCPPGEYSVTVTPLSKVRPGTGGPGGPAPELRQVGTSPSIIPEAYWKIELTKLTAIVPAKGDTNLTLQLTATGR